MVANRDIEPGEVIFQDRAAAVGPSESNPLCLDCNAKVLMILTAITKNKESAI